MTVFFQVKEIIDRLSSANDFSPTDFVFKLLMLALASWC
jgi:hypothetical protein